MKAVRLLSALPLSSPNAAFNRRKVLSLLPQRLSHPGTRRLTAPSWRCPAGCFLVHAPLAHARATVASCELRAVGDELCARDGISVTGQAAAAARDVGNTKDALRLKLYGDKTLARQLQFGQHRAQLACDLHAVHENIVLLLAAGDIRELVGSSARDPCHVP